MARTQGAQSTAQAGGRHGRVRPFAFASFLVWLLCLTGLVDAAGWYGAGTMLVTALTLLSGAAYVRPEWVEAVASFLHRMGGDR